MRHEMEHGKKREDRREGKGVTHEDDARVGQDKGLCEKGSVVGSVGFLAIYARTVDAKRRFAASFLPRGSGVRGGEREDDGREQRHRLGRARGKRKGRDGQMSRRGCVIIG